MADTDRLHEALGTLRHAVERARPRLPTRATDPERDARRQRLRWHLEKYLLPRVLDLDAPLVTVLLGSTGAGKSSLLNGLAGWRVSPAGVTRPTTRRPVVLVAVEEEGALRAATLGSMARAARLEVVADASAFRGIALVDAPDLDSVEAANRAAADELLQTADLVVFVTTAQRYADAVPWDFLSRARDRGAPLLVVLNRLPQRAADREAIVADCRRLFEEAGLGSAGPAGSLEIVAIQEGELDEARDGLSAAAVAPLRAQLATLAAGGSAALNKVKLLALRGALDGLPVAVAAVAHDLEADERRAATLRAVVRRSYQEQLRELEQRLASGVFLRGEVMRAWQEFVGAGDVARMLTGGIGRVRAWLWRRFGPSQRVSPPLEHAKEHAFEELAAALVRHADVAAETVAEDWSADPGSAPLLADRADLWGHDTDLPARARTELQAWLGRLTGLVEERGRTRKALAFTAALGVNAVGVAAMLAVFAHSAGLTGGEIAIAGGTAVVNQKLLEAIFGESAVDGIVRHADQDLRATLARLLDRDAERFLALVAPAEVTPEELEAAAQRVLQEASALAGLDATSPLPPTPPMRRGEPAGGDRR